MKSLGILGFLFAAALNTSVAWGEEAESGEEDAAQALQAIAPPSAKKAGDIVGEIQIRPSIGYGTGQTKAENIAVLGMRLGANSLVDYTQYFNGNLADPTGKTQAGLVGQDGFLRSRFQKLWQNVGSDLTLDYENRLYLPTDPAKAARGLIAGLRNYVSLTKRFTSKFAVTVQEIPILYAFSRSGTPDMNPAVNGSANAWFENRVYIIPTFDITNKIVFSLPVMLWASRTRDFASNVFSSDRWMMTAMIWPELTYAISPKTFVGVSYYSDNFVNKKQDGFDFMAGLSKGVGQLLLRQTL
jgi:hypothetical protein